MKTEEAKTIFWLSAIVTGFALMIAAGVTLQIKQSSIQICGFVGTFVVLGYFSIASFYEFLKKRDSTDQASRILLILAGIISIPVGFVIFVINIVSALFRWFFGKPG